MRDGADKLTVGLGVMRTTKFGAMAPQSTATSGLSILLICMMESFDLTYFGNHTMWVASLCNITADEGMYDMDCIVTFCTEVSL